MGEYENCITCDSFVDGGVGWGICLHVDKPTRAGNQCNVIFKSCKICRRHYPADVGTWFALCPEHSKSGLSWIISHIKRIRFIAPALFDVYRYYPPRKGNTAPELRHACRICGGYLLTKKGHLSSVMRVCQDCHTKPIPLDDYAISWAETRWRYVDDRMVILTDRDERGRDVRMEYTYCEDCGDVLVHSAGWNSHHRNDVVEVHHKRPVHVLTFDDIHMIWDESNLVLLCKQCHLKWHAELREDDRLRNPPEEKPTWSPPEAKPGQKSLLKWL